MGEKTIIAWTGHTFNIAWGCVKVSPGCDHCYAERNSARYGHNVWGKGAARRTFGAEHWREPFKWNRQAEENGRIGLVFSSSMCDIFENHPTIDQEREKLWPLIRQTPNLHWQLLTKRAERIKRHLPKDWGDKGYPNVWLGISAENQKYYDLRYPFLAKIPALVRFVSYEPALGPIDFGFPPKHLPLPNWVIYGGESGVNFRPEDKNWARSMRQQCKLAGTAFFHKQSSGYRTEMGIELDGEIVREYPISLELRRPLFA